MLPIDRARAYLARMGPAVEGQGGDVKTWKAAAVCVADFGLDDAEALAVLREWNTSCSPPWSERELEAKIRSARRNARHKTGTKLEDARGRPVERPLPPATYPEAHRLAHKLRDPKFYTARTKRAVNSLTIERGPKVVSHE